MVSASQNQAATFADETSIEPAAASLDTTASGVSTELAGLAGLTGLEVQQLAAEGYFQAIAYWLNEPLVPQNVYAQVLADQAPGCIKVLVEFERAPQPKRLLKFVCDRIYKLNSNVIEGIYLVARAVGTGKTDWEQRIRIPTAGQRVRKTPTPVTSPETAPETVPGTDLSQQTDTGEFTQPQPDDRQPNPLQPDSAINHSESNNPENNNGAIHDHEPGKTPQLLHESSRSKIARSVVRSQFKFFRAALITGSATAAFLFGGLTELILSERLSDPIATEAVPTAAPWYDEPAATEVAFSQGRRFKNSKTVEAALETVAVVPHTDVAQPDDPTVTLLFGGELGLNDFIFEEAESLDQLFSNLSIYKKADVAMIGLSEPLATASTSLQENFYRRTRPQAVQALKAGGIDIVTLASEGTLTYGSRGLAETLNTLDRQGIYRVGAGRDQQEAHRPEILEIKGQRIAYLGYNPEAVKAAKEDKAGVALTNSKERSHIVEDIRAIRSQVDWVVVNYRWGDILGQTSESEAAPTPAPDNAQTGNFKAIPEDWQKSLAHDAVDAGADLVVGYHPSQIQGAEIYRDRAIAYSLGDFVFGEAPLEDHDTAALRVSLRNQQMKVEFLPVSVRDSQIQMATGEQGTAILQGIRQASKTFDHPLRFPVVLKATSTPSPAPTPFISDPTSPTAPETSTPTSTPQLIEPTESTAPIEPLAPIEPIPEQFLPDEATTEAPEPDYEAPAPHPTLRESEALFPEQPAADETEEEDTTEKDTTKPQATISSEQPHNEPAEVTPTSPQPAP